MKRALLCLGLTGVLALSVDMAAQTKVGGGAQEVRAGQTKKLQLEQFFDMESVSNPRISPDGKQIVYTRGWVDKINDRRSSGLWIMNADGSRNRFLTNGSGAIWSPDGTRIAFTREGEPSGSQIWVKWMDADGAAATQITHLDQSPSNITWTPDGKSIAFTMLVPKRESWPIRMPARPEGAKWTEAPRIVESLTYRADRQGFIDQGLDQIYVVPAEGGTERRVTDGQYDYGGAFSFTPDGKEIVFSTGRGPNWEREYRQTDVFALNVSTGALRQITARSGPDTSPTVSPDGRWIAYLGYDYTTDTYIDNELYVVGLNGAGMRHMTPKFDRSPADLTWAPDSTGIYFTADDSGSRNLHLAPLDGPITMVTKGVHLVSLSDVNRTGQAVGTLTSFHKPGDIISFSLSNPGVLKQLTNVNEDVLGDVKLGEVEEIWYDSLDNYRIQGWLIKPPDFDPSKKYPLMLSIHGGPHSMYGVGFNFAWQEHAANGYLVLYTNPRGSTGYGSTFGNAIKYAYPSKDFDDLMKGVDTAIAKGNVDTRNMFVYGCSGGGVLTAWTVGHTNRFAAAASQCPVINWISFVGNVDGNPLRWYDDFEKFPWVDPSEHLRRSPLMYVGNVKTPTMLMTGVLDMRTPISQTEEFYQALKAVGVPTAMLRFNGEYHGTSSRPSNFLRTQLYLRYWFEKYTTK